MFGSLNPLPVRLLPRLFHVSCRIIPPWWMHGTSSRYKSLLQLAIPRTTSGVECIDQKPSVWIPRSIMISLVKLFDQFWIILEQVIEDPSLATTLRLELRGKRVRWLRSTSLGTYSIPRLEPGEPIAENKDLLLRCRRRDHIVSCFRVDLDWRQTIPPLSPADIDD